MKIEIELVRAGRRDPRALDLPEGSTVRDALRAAGLFAEGSAVLVDGAPVPLDRPLAPFERLEIVPTFSGG
ncbi:MAG: MoaD/ThiS family protein [Thermoplasmata archaeon]